MVMKNKKSIILTGGEGGYGNLGDEWLLEAVKLRYKNIKNAYKIIILMQRPKADSNKFYYSKDYIENFKEMNLDIKNIKAVHFFGGGYLNNYWAHLKLWLYDYLDEIGYNKKNIYFTGHGLGPLNIKLFRKVRDISNDVKLFGTRDNAFKKIIKQRFMFDETIYTINCNKVPKNKKSKNILVNFRVADYVGLKRDKIKRLLIEIYRIAKKDGYNIKFFPMINNDSYNEKKEMIRILREYGIKADILERPKDYKELLKIISDCSLVVTTSYHATLASIYSNTPVIAVYKSKYYKMKFNTLKNVLPTNLLRVIKSSNINKRSFDGHIGSVDRELTKKLLYLRGLSDKAYRIYFKFLDSY